MSSFTERKTLSFGENDKELYEFCMKNSENIGIKFATFVKQVLREKMQQKDEPLEEVIERKIEDYLKNKNILLEDKKEQKPKFNAEDKSALLSYMNIKK